MNVAELQVVSKSHLHMVVIPLAENKLLNAPCGSIHSSLCTDFSGV